MGEDLQAAGLTAWPELEQTALAVATQGQWQGATAEEQREERTEHCSRLAHSRLAHSPQAHEQNDQLWVAERVGPRQVAANLFSLLQT